MFRQISFRSYITMRVAIVVIGFGAITGSPRSLFAVGLNYVDANDFTNLTPAAAIDSFNSIPETPTPDNLWDVRTDFGLGLTVFQASAEDAQQLTQKITGLTTGKSYDVYAVYTTDDDENWTIRTGVSPGNLTLYSFWGDRGPSPVAGSTQGLTAGAAVWDTLPPVNKESTVFTERAADTLVQLLAKAGTIAANGAGEIDVLIDDLPNIAPNTGPRRTWLEGVAYVDAGTQIALTATLDRATGAVTINNPTATPFQFKSYSLVSASGELNANTWTKIAGWDVTAAPDATSPFATDLTQTDATMTGTTIAANGGSLSFGNVGQKTPFPEDILIRLTRNDNEIAVIAPQYTGSLTTITVGDFDASGAINVTDFQSLLTNLHTNVQALSLAGAHSRGDMNSDRLINFNDFVLFRAAYDLQHGAGSFASLVPEPSTFAMVFMSMTGCVLIRRRVGRNTIALSLAWALLSMSGSAYALDIKVDLNSMRTSGTATAGPLSTQTGFTSWDLTNVATAGSTITVDGVMFEIFGLNAANQSRVRTNMDGTLNGGGGTFNDILADFVFNEGADMRAIGLRITNLPVGEYMMQSWHHDLTIATPEVTQVEIRNQGDPTDPSQIVVPATAWSDMPLEYPLTVTTAGQVREVIFREASTGNRARFNGFTIIGDALPPPVIQLTLQVNTTTGAVSIRNEQNINFDMSYYEVRSPSGALSPAGWTSLDDAEGVDPVATGWDEAAVSTPNLLNEVNLTSMSTFAPSNSSNLGNAFTPGGMQDVTFLYAGPGETLLRTGIIKYVTGPSGVNGDYNGNNVVDAADYVLWRDKLGTTTTLPNDTTPGNVTQEDFTVWRANFGKTAGAGAGLINGAAVPEPATIVSAVLLMLASLQSQRRTRGNGYSKLN